MDSGRRELLSAGDIELARDMIHKIQLIAHKISHPITLMHICGTHEYTIAKNGIRSLFPPTLKVIPGPGCPVCVCSANEIDAAITIAQKPDTILTSFGDMVRVPASKYSLEEIRARGADVRIVYGPNEAIELARQNPQKEVVFFAIGFETTAPLIGYELCSNPPSNFSVISAHKLVPPAFDLLLGVEKLQIDGFLLPGHVSAIIGSDIYKPYAKKYHVPMVVGGFEVNDVLSSILMLLRQILNKNTTIENNYSRVVKPEGNPVARKVMQEAFVIGDTIWRGIGKIPQSGLLIHPHKQSFNALLKFKIRIDPNPHFPPGCSCNLVLLGQKIPQECPLFGNICTPEHPVGPCMVSHEGTCKITYMFSSVEY